MSVGSCLFQRKKEKNFAIKSLPNRTLSSFRWENSLQHLNLALTERTSDGDIIKTKVESEARA